MNLASRQVSLKLDGMWGSWWMIIVFWIPYCLPVQWTLKLCTCGQYTGFAVYYRLFDKSQGNKYICYLIHTLYHITTPSCQCGHVRGSSVSVRHFWGTCSSQLCIDMWWADGQVSGAFNFLVWNTLYKFPTEKWFLQGRTGMLKACN